MSDRAGLGIELNEDVLAEYRVASAVCVTRAIRLDPRDNVAVATDELAAGDEVAFEGGAVTLGDPIAVGHKFAIAAIALDERVYKYGEVIGVAIRAIPWVRTCTSTTC